MRQFDFMRGPPASDVSLAQGGDTEGSATKEGGRWMDKVA
jgi:hypothetical protein